MSSRLNGCRAFLSADDLLEMQFYGQLEAVALNRMLEDADVIIEDIKSRRQRDLLLVDVSAMGKVAHHARKNGIRWIKKSKVEKISVYGGSLYNKYFVNMLIKALRRQQRMRMHQTRDEAMAWLKQ